MNTQRTKPISLFESDEKFAFSIEFQLEVLRFLIQSKESMLILPRVKSSYFALIEHSLVTEALQKFCKKFTRVPSEPLMVEQCKEIMESKAYSSLITQEDVVNVNRLIKDLYHKPLRDEDIIRDNIYKFAAYVDMKMLNETMDFSNFSAYEEYQSKVANIIRNSRPLKDEEPLMMVQGTTKRQLMRKINPNVVPTPYWQLNNLSNGNGYSKGSIFVLLDKPKAKKTFTLVNLARGYLMMKKNVLYIDTENGKELIMERMIQSTLNKTKLEILSGDFDKLEQSHMRKYKRLGVEFIVERVPALVGDTNTIKGIIQKLEAERGIKISVLVVDYAAKLASLGRHKEDVDRINNVYIELDNLAHELDLDAIWTAQHITREGAKHRETCYEDNDIASSISIVRNAQCILGLNSTEEEESHNIQRLEVVVQRDGKPHGRCLFNIDPDRQRWKEFTKSARAKYDETQGKVVDEMISKSKKKDKKAAATGTTKKEPSTGDI